MTTFSYDSLWDNKLQADYKAGRRGLKQNRQTGLVAPPPETAFMAIPRGAAQKSLYDQGVALLKKGKLGVVHLNGGLATRFGHIKATHEVGEFLGRARTFLELKISHVLWAQKTYGGDIFYGLMNSPMTQPVTEEFLADNKGFGMEGGRMIAYVQSVLRRKVPRQEDVREYFAAMTPPPCPSPRTLTPPSPRGRGFKGMDRGREKGGAFVEPAQYAPAGHFDAVAALVLTRTIGRFIDAGVEYLQISNIDNLAATVEPAILGALVQSSEDLLVEVALKNPGDRGGIPIFWNDKGVVLMEEFALPKGFDAASVRQFNTATYWVKISAILKIFDLTSRDVVGKSDADLMDRVRRVRQKIPTYTILKEIEAEGGGRVLTVQDEQLLGDLTRLYLETTGRSAAYLLIDTKTRFIPIKTKEDLIKEGPRIRAVLQDKIVFY